MKKNSQKKTLATSKITTAKSAAETNPNMPTTKNLCIKDLNYANYQRIQNLARIKEIHNNLDWDIFGVITVSYRDGKFYVVDGQHRVEAARGITETLPCQVWHDLTYKQECEKFSKLNTLRKSLNAAQKFFADVEMGDEDAVAVVRIAKKFGFALNKNNYHCKENEIGSPKTLWYIKKNYSERILEDTLYVLRTAWGGGKEYIGSDNIRGIAMFLFNHSDANRDILVEALRGITPNDIKFRAITNSMSFNNKYAPTRITQVQRANAICDFYNNTARAKNLRTVA